MHTRPSISTETMELLLASVSDCEVWSVIRFLYVRGETTAEIHTLHIHLIWHHVTFICSLVCTNISLARYSTQQRKSKQRLWNTSKIWTLSTIAMVYESYINDIRNVQICEGITWKNRKFCHESACILFNCFGPVVVEKKKCVNLLFENPSQFLSDK